MARTYENPIVRGFNPDPSIVRVGEDFYMVNSTFQYFPGVIIRHSKDLVNWEIIGHAFTENENLAMYDISDSHGIWAPDISYYNGLFYIFAPLRLNNAPENTSGQQRRQLVVTSKTPEGPYSKPFVVNVDSIDPSHFVDDDGTHYMVTAPAVTVTKLNDECSKAVEPPVKVWAGTGLSAAEGPHIFKKGEYYYAVLAEGGTGYNHQVSVGRSKNVYGPYESSPYNPVMKQMNPDAKIQRSGHGKLVETQNGDWWIVYLCGRRNQGNYTTVGRETSLDPVTWTDDGWFTVNDSKGPSEVQVCPNLPEHKFESRDFDDFDGDKISPVWEFVRNPHYDMLSLTERKGSLALTTTEFDLNLRCSYNTMVRRETEHCYTATTSLDFTPTRTEEAGMTCYYGLNNYIKFYLTYQDLNRRGDGYVLKVKTNISENITCVATKKVDTDKLYLQIRVDKQKRSFYYSLDNENWEFVGEVPDCTFLCDEGVTTGKHHTGTMVGLYAYNGGSGAKLKAYFDWFDYCAK